MRLLSIEALGQDQYRCGFAAGTFELRVEPVDLPGCPGAVTIEGSKEFNDMVWGHTQNAAEQRALYLEICLAARAAKREEAV